ncbi:hypothetical protein H2200_010585 [Cladophialophora chaetospira]|uniref:DUF7704 domain-containing protein n=1 Tax=Cladophialophora chaetospira TaxID=386627 RepID=A0AA39CE98_9EURO|nr:hypothetical protein H2200_010585 [Cladophialophora chaetospira]
MASRIPTIYRFWFTQLDPFLTIIGIFCNFFAPNFLLAGLNPTYQSPPTSETILLLDTGGAWFIAILILQLGLLRSRPNDVLVWRYYAAAVGTVDTIVCAAILRALNAQGRLGFDAWRSEEWVNFGSTAACAVVRIALVLGVGIDDRLDKMKGV